MTKATYVTDAHSSLVNVCMQKRGREDLVRASERYRQNPGQAYRTEEQRQVTFCGNSSHADSAFSPGNRLRDVRG